MTAPGGPPIAKPPIAPATGLSPLGSMKLTGLFWTYVEIT